MADRAGYFDISDEFAGRVSRSVLPIASSLEVWYVKSYMKTEALREYCGSAEEWLASMLE